LDDVQIISKLKQADDECFIEVVNNFKKKIISLCYSYVKDYQEAEDLSQEVFITLYNNIQRFRGECSLSTYIYRITISRCLDYKRKTKFKSILTNLMEIRKVSETVDIDDKNYIRECIRKLPDDLKIVIVLYYYIGMSQKEIADILDITTKTVEGRIYRAKKKLKKEFIEEGNIVCSKRGMI